MDKDRLAQQISDLVPDRPSAPYMDMHTQKDVEKEATRVVAQRNAKELAKLRYAEKRKLKAEETKQQQAKALGLTLDEGQTIRQAQKIAEHEAKIKAIDAIEAETVDPLNVSRLSAHASDNTNVTPGINSNIINQALRLQGPTRPEIAKLLTSLNINLSVQLTKHDTANLLACLLTCNENQLDALYSNKKIPIVIRTVIKRLKEDAKLGNMETVERLWDRVFGKGQMQLDLPEPQQLQTGIIPNVPVSREAYIVIRDTLMK